MRRSTRTKTKPQLFQMQRDFTWVADKLTKRAINSGKKTWHTIEPHVTANFNCGFHGIDWKQAANVSIVNYTRITFGSTQDLTALVLDGANAGTTSVLTRFGGLRHENITAVSSQAGVAASIATKFPSVNAVQSDLQAFIDTTQDAYDIIYIDLCGTWRKHKDVIFYALRAAKKKCVFAFAVSRRRFKISEEKLKSEFAQHWEQVWKPFNYAHRCTIVTGGTPSYYVMVYEFY
jgi:hypothetical protein